MKKLYVLIVVAMLAAMVLPMTASAAPGDDPYYIHGTVWDKTNGIGIGGTLVQLYYERTTIVSADRWDPDRYLREWELIDTCVTESRGFWMVDSLHARTGGLKIVFTAPDDALLPDGQAVTYTADNTYVFNDDTPGVDDEYEMALPEDPDLEPNQCQYVWYNAFDANTPPVTDWWRRGDINVNYMADTTLTPPADCAVVDTLYVYGTLFNPNVAGVQVVLEEWFARATPGGGWTLLTLESVRAKPSAADGTYIFMLNPTDSPGNDFTVYRVWINGVFSEDFTAITCPKEDSLRVELDFNMIAGAFDDPRSIGVDVPITGPWDPPYAMYFGFWPVTPLHPSDAVSPLP